MNSKLVRAVVVAAAISVSFACVSTANASLNKAGAGEPPTTKGSSNTWWFSYVPSSTGYVMCFTLYKNSQVVKTYPSYPDGGYPGTSNGMCTQPYYGLTQSGTIYYNETGLEAGATYTVCGTTFENYGDGLWFMRVSSYEPCSTTTIDNGKPSLTTWVGGEATYTKNPVIPVHMAYQDALSHPWSRNRSSSTALAATVGCLTRGDSCTPTEIVDGCSQPNTPRYTQTPGAKSNSFDCAYDFTNYEDGRVTFCARQSDWALTDKPNSTDQFAGSSSTQANVSDVACGN
ncbi:MAG TPA: hypothetical protein VGR12_08215, partial [Solirubrobacteraceae bacterium]|nr:hypothetical protein [Solirubrobacteraceae bacterium]